MEMRTTFTLNGQPAELRVVSEPTGVAPFYIEIALHYWTRPTDHDGICTPAGREFVADMLERGLLVPSEKVDRRRYMAGPALRTWVEALCRVPFPVQQWVIPED